MISIGLEASAVCLCLFCLTWVWLFVLFLVWVGRGKSLNILPCGVEIKSQISEWKRDRRGQEGETESEHTLSSIMSWVKGGPQTLHLLSPMSFPSDLLLHKGNDRRLFWSLALCFPDIAAPRAGASSGMTAQFLVALLSHPQDDPTWTLGNGAQLWG